MHNRIGARTLRQFFLLLAVTAVFAGAAVAQGGTAPALTIQTASLPRGLLGQPYQIQLEAEGGTTPYQWQIAGGALPKGLSLGEDGILRGTPEETGQFRFSLIVTDSEKPAQQQSKELVLPVLAPLLAKWGRSPTVNGRRIEGSLKVSNQTEEDFDLTVIVLGVNEIGRATALGYQHFTLPKGTLEKEIPFGESLPAGSYQVNADVVAEVTDVDHIHRARLVSNGRLQVMQGP